MANERIQKGQRVLPALQVKEVLAALTLIELVRSGIVTLEADYQPRMQEARRVLAEYAMHEGIATEGEVVPF